MDRKIRVVIADDHVMVRGGLQMFLESIDYIDLVGQASNGDEVIQLCLETSPDVVLMDLMMPKVNGIEAIQSIHRTNPNIKIIALTSFKDDEMVYSALKFGAVNYLLKDVSYDELAEVIQNAYDGKNIIKPEVTQALIRMAEKPSAPVIQLSTREREVLRLMTHGLSNSQIACELHLGDSTVKFHVSNILSKCNVATRTEAVAMAIQYKLIE